MSKQKAGLEPKATQKRKKTKTVFDEELLKGDVMDVEDTSKAEDAKDKESSKKKSTKKQKLADLDMASLSDAVLRMLNRYILSEEEIDRRLRHLEKYLDYAAEENLKKMLNEGRNWQEDKDENIALEKMSVDETQPQELALDFKDPEEEEDSFDRSADELKKGLKEEELKESPDEFRERLKRQQKRQAPPLSEEGAAPHTSPEEIKEHVKKRLHAQNKIIQDIIRNFDGAEKGFPELFKKSVSSFILASSHLEDDEDGDDEDYEPYGHRSPEPNDKPIIHLKTGEPYDSVAAYIVFLLLAGFERQNITSMLSIAESLPKLEKDNWHEILTELLTLPADVLRSISGIYSRKGIPNYDDIGEVKKVLSWCEEKFPEDSKAALRLFSSIASIQHGKGMPDGLLDDLKKIFKWCEEKFPKDPRAALKLFSSVTSIQHSKGMPDGLLDDLKKIFKWCEEKFPKDPRAALKLFSSVTSIQCQRGIDGRLLDNLKKIFKWCEEKFPEDRRTALKLFSSIAVMQSKKGLPDNLIDNLDELFLWCQTNFPRNKSTYLKERHESKKAIIKLFRLIVIVNFQKKVPTKQEIDLFHTNCKKVILRDRESSPTETEQALIAKIITSALIAIKPGFSSSGFPTSEHFSRFNEAISSAYPLDYELSESDSNEVAEIFIAIHNLIKISILGTKSEKKVRREFCLQSFVKTLANNIDFIKDKVSEDSLATSYLTIETAKQIKSIELLLSQASQESRSAADTLFSVEHAKQELSKIYSKILKSRTDSIIFYKLLCRAVIGQSALSSEQKKSIFEHIAGLTAEVITEQSAMMQSRFEKYGELNRASDYINHPLDSEFDIPDNDNGDDIADLAEHEEDYASNNDTALQEEPSQWLPSQEPSSPKPASTELLAPKKPIEAQFYSDKIILQILQTDPLFSSCLATLPYYLSHDKEDLLFISEGLSELTKFSDAGDAKRALLVPIQINFNHWIGCFITYNSRERRFVAFYTNSLPEVEGNYFYEVAVAMANALSQTEHKDKEITLENLELSELQQDSISCGPITLEVFRMLVQYCSEQAERNVNALDAYFMSKFIKEAFAREGLNYDFLKAKDDSIIKSSSKGGATILGSDHVAKFEEGHEYYEDGFAQEAGPAMQEENLLPSLDLLKQEPSALSGWYSGEVINGALEGYKLENPESKALIAADCSLERIDFFSAALKRSLKSIKKSNTNSVILPVNINENHWVLCFLVFSQDKKEFNIIYSDPLQADEESRDSIIENIKKVAGLQGLRIGSVRDLKLTLQYDGSSCGPILVETARIIDRFVTDFEFDVFAEVVFKRMSLRIQREIPNEPDKIIEMRRLHNSLLQQHLEEVKKRADDLGDGYDVEISENLEDSKPEDAQKIEESLPREASLSLDKRILQILQTDPNFKSYLTTPPYHLPNDEKNLSFISQGLSELAKYPSTDNITMALLVPIHLTFNNHQTGCFIIYDSEKGRFRVFYANYLPKLKYFSHEIEVVIKKALLQTDHQDKIITLENLELDKLQKDSIDYAPATLEVFRILIQYCKKRSIQMLNASLMSVSIKESFLKNNLTYKSLKAKDDSIITLSGASSTTVTRFSHEAEFAQEALPAPQEMPSATVIKRKRLKDESKPRKPKKPKHQATAPTNTLQDLTLDLPEESYPLTLDISSEYLFGEFANPGATDLPPIPNQYNAADDLLPTAAMHASETITAILKSITKPEDCIIASACKMQPRAAAVALIKEILLQAETSPQSILLIPIQLADGNWAGCFIKKNITPDATHYQAFYLDPSSSRGFEEFQQVLHESLSDSSVNIRINFANLELEGASIDREDITACTLSAFDFLINYYAAKQREALGSLDPRSQLITQTEVGFIKAGMIIFCTAFLHSPEHLQNKAEYQRMAHQLQAMPASLPSLDLGDIGLSLDFANPRTSPIPSGTSILRGTKERDSHNV